MIKQTFKHIDGDIRIENAETLEEARKEGFPDGVFTRYYIGDKQVQTYTEIIKHILTSTQKGSLFQQPTKEDLKTMQRNLIDSQKQMLRDQLEALKKTYAGMNISQNVLDQFDKIKESIDLAGVRVI